MTDEEIDTMVLDRVRNLITNWCWRGVVSDGYVRSNEEPLMAAAETLAAIELELSNRKQGGL